MTGLDPNTELGGVTLIVGDLDLQAAYYRGAIGLCMIDRDAGVATLGAPGNDDALVTLRSRPDAPLRSPRTTGLFHLALRVPTRHDLGWAFSRVSEAGHQFTGAADHLVSEALYLSDPEGNGIEIYSDRPRDTWPRAGAQIEMATLPLDMTRILQGTDGLEAPAGMSAGTRVGHVHLQVADLDAAEAFYVGAIGFDVMARLQSSALFISAGGYHHHVGLNTWAGRGAPPSPAGARGLESFDIVFPDGPALARTISSIEEAGFPVATKDGAATVVDPSANRVRLRLP